MKNLYTYTQRRKKNKLKIYSLNQKESKSFILCIFFFRTSLIFTIRKREIIIIIMSEVEPQNPVDQQQVDAQNQKPAVERKILGI